MILTGARQTGKTTLLRHVFPEHRYVSLDLPSDAAAAERAPDEFFRRYPPPVVIDEVQYAPGLFRHLKADIDAHRHERGRFILTGSQKFTLMKEVSDSLAGRCAWLELEGLSGRELGTGAVDVHGQVMRILARGQFPELWRDPAIPRADFLRAFLATYIERDVRQILNVSSLRDFERFVRLCATYNAQLLNKTELARGVGVTTKTIDQWLGVLHASNQIALLEPYFANLGKRIVKSPKLYFCDTGLLCFLLGVDEVSLAESALLGSIWESFVYAELRKTARCAGSGPSALVLSRPARPRGGLHRPRRRWIHLYRSEVDGAAELRRRALATRGSGVARARSAEAVARSANDRSSSTHAAPARRRNACRPRRRLEPRAVRSLMASGHIGEVDGARVAIVCVAASPPPFAIAPQDV